MAEAQPPARRGFASDRLADEHLCDHVLTRPEAHDWALVIPDYRSFAEPTDDATLRRLAASLFTGPPLAEVVALRDRYVAAVLQAIDDACRLHWWWEEVRSSEACWIGLGLEGIK